MVPATPPQGFVPSSTSGTVPSQIKNAELDQEGCLLLSRLGRLPDVMTVPVLDWALGGLGTRFAVLYAATIRHMVLSFRTRQPIVIRLYCLIAMYLPALILHDARPDCSCRDATDTHYSHRSTIALRLRAAENAQCSSLCQELLQAHLLVSPPKEKKEALWETKCARAATRSLAGGWAIVFRALQPDRCPPSKKTHFKKPPANFIPMRLRTTKEPLCSPSANKLPKFPPPN